MECGKMVNGKRKCGSKEYGGKREPVSSVYLTSRHINTVMQYLISDILTLKYFEKVVTICYDDRYHKVD